MKECRMDEPPSKSVCGRSTRPLRNRRYSRRAFVAGQRPAKKLFTPEIKRLLKDWLVRRRDNPYPNREEKKFLANQTGLTYVQICNWFANWRRKLKNVNAERRRNTWGHLIKTYNDRAHGNVEQFSICSEDSIWGETDRLSPQSDESFENEYKTPSRNILSSPNIQQCYQISSTTEELIHIGPNNNTYSKTSQRELADRACEVSCAGFENKAELSGALLLSKWLESAARFQPRETNYGCWSGKARGNGGRLVMATSAVHTPPAAPGRARHGHDEVEAALALTVLATTATLPPHKSTQFLSPVNEPIQLQPWQI